MLTLTLILLLSWEECSKSLWSPRLTMSNPNVSTESWQNMVCRIILEARFSEQYRVRPHAP